jgi:hypothetical protein
MIEAMSSSFAQINKFHSAASCGVDHGANAGPPQALERPVAGNQAFLMAA